MTGTFEQVRIGGAEIEGTVVKIGFSAVQRYLRDERAVTAVEYGMIDTVLSERTGMGGDKSD